MLNNYCCLTSVFIVLLIARTPLIIVALKEAELTTTIQTENSKMAEKKIVPTISKLEEFENRLPCFLDANKTLALLLDYDGTLAPIVDNPANSAIPANLSKTLHKLAKHPKIFIALISGRGIDDLMSRIGIENVAFSGNHGMEIQNQDGTRNDFQVPDEIQKAYTKLVKELNEKVAKNGGWVEDKKVSLTYHYRDVQDKEIDKLKQMTIEIIEKHGFKVNLGHGAIEGKSPVNRNKGYAANYILEHNFGKDWAQKIKVIFVGDDTTDEDAMMALQGIGKSFRIADNPKLETYADFRLPSQDVVNDLMTWISCTYN